jgi:hypothetical protein
MYSLKQGWAAAWNRLLLHETPDISDVRDKHWGFVNSAECRLIAARAQDQQRFRKGLPLDCVLIHLHPVHFITIYLSKITAVGIRCADHVTPLFPQKLALTSPTGGGRSVGIVRSRTKATEFSLFIENREIWASNYGMICGIAWWQIVWKGKFL